MNVFLKETPRTSIESWCGGEDGESGYGEMLKIEGEFDYEDLSISGCTE